MKIFYTVDKQSRVWPACDWTADIEPDESWHVGNIPGVAYEEHGVPLYKEKNGSIVQRTDAEIQADINAQPIPDPTENELLRADVDYLLMLMGE